jgi:molybdate transport system substrate-binding protein
MVTMGLAIQGLRADDLAVAKKFEIVRAAATLAAAVIGAVGVFTAAAPHGAADLKVRSAVGMRQVMVSLGPQFTRATGHTLAMTFDSTGLIANRIAAGADADVVIINRSAIDRLGHDGTIVAQSVAHIATSVAAVAVRSGAEIPDISSPDAFKRLLLSARLVARPPATVGGSSGDHIVKVLERLGIAAEVNAKSVFVMTGSDGQASESPGDAVARGKADVALHQLQELLAVPGIAIVGPFPGDLQGTFDFSAAIATTAQEPAAARALIAFLQTPHARDVIRTKGMRPIEP